MGLLYGRAGRLTAENGGFWPAQEADTSTFAGTERSVPAIVNARVIVVAPGSTKVRAAADHSLVNIKVKSAGLNQTLLQL
jgi:hypothetical protein